MMNILSDNNAFNNDEEFEERKPSFSTDDDMGMNQFATATAMLNLKKTKFGGYAPKSVNDYITRIQNESRQVRDQMEKQIEGLLAEKRTVTQECDFLHSQIKESERSLQEAREQLKTMFTQEQMDAANEKVSTLEKSLSEVTEQIEMLNQSADEQKQLLDQACAERDHLAIVCSENSTMISHLETSYSDAVKEQERLVRENRVLEVGLKGSKEEITEEIQRILADNQKLEEENNTLRKQMDDFERAAPISREELEELVLLRQQNARDLEFIQSENERLDQKKEDLVAEMQTINDKLLELQHQEELAQQTADALSQRENLVRDAENDIIQREATLQESETALKQSEEALRNSQSELAQQEALLQNAKNELTQKENQLQQAETEFSQRVTQTENTLKERENRLQEQENALTQRESAVQQSVDSMTAREVRVQESENVFAEKEAGIQRANQALTERESQVQESENAVMQRKTELQQAENALTEREAALQNVEKALSQRQAALQQAENALTERETALQEATNAVMQREATVQELEDALSQKLLMLDLDHDEPDDKEAFHLSESLAPPSFSEELMQYEELQNKWQPDGASEVKDKISNDFHVMQLDSQTEMNAMPNDFPDETMQSLRNAEAEEKQDQHLNSLYDALSQMMDSLEHQSSNMNRLMSQQESLKFENADLQEARNADRGRITELEAENERLMKELQRIMNVRDSKSSEVIASAGNTSKKAESAHGAPMPDAIAKARSILQKMKNDLGE